MATKKARRRGAPKRKTSRVTPPKFVGITHSRVLIDDNVSSGLFGLDEAGGVWQYDFDHGMWYQLASKRVPNMYPDANSDEDN